MIGKRVISIVLISGLFFSANPVFAYGENENGAAGNDINAVETDNGSSIEEIIIESFRELTPETRNQTYYAGAARDDIDLPSTLTGLYYDSKGSPQETVIGEVEWVCEDFNGKKAGRYVFTADFDMPEGYRLPEGETVAITVTIDLKRIYQTPGRYFKIQDYIPTRKSGYDLRKGMSGLKVYYVQKKLKCYYGHAKYTSATASNVKSFQRKKGLKATGVVDKATWLKMGYKEKGWYYTDSYVTPLKVKKNSNKAAHVNAMIKTAKEYLGTRYVWCASGKPGRGVDCAGLVIQCLYSAGIDPLPVGSHVYAYSKNEYTSRKLWNSKKFKHVKFSNKKKGDLIVYHDGTGTVNHISIYIGGGREIETFKHTGVIVSKVSSRVKGILRPII